MNWLRALSSSVGKKFLMAITGLLLCGFLVTHLAGNLLITLGGTHFDDYAHKLHSNEGLLMVAETGLFGIFILHLYLAMSLTWGNTTARGRGYAVTKSKRDDTVTNVRPDKWMIGSGIILFAYILLHLFDFKFQRFGWDPVLNELVGDSESVTTKVAVHVLKSPVTLVGYAAGFVFLFAHLSHGVSSACQSLGLNHSKYNCLIKWGSIAFAAVIFVGFLYVLLWAAGQPTPGPEVSP